jgi:hypothetical protein
MRDYNLFVEDIEVITDNSDLDRRFLKFEAMKSKIQRYMFRMGNDCATIVNALNLADWLGLLSGRGIDCCVEVFLKMVWSCFERHVVFF